MALRGVRVLELAGLAPVPFCGMVLADFGAEVIRVDKAYGQEIDSKLGRGKMSIAVDLKKSEGRNIVAKLASKSDVIIEPYRAGVMEKLGLGPKPLLEANPRLIYARLTGYGQNGPLSTHAGHDINFLSYSGILWAMGSPDSKPKFPINLLADFAGGGLLCSFAIASALFQRSVTGKGQVLELSMTQGAAYVGSWLWRSRQAMPFVWPNVNVPGTNLLDGGMAFYTTYRTKDGGYVAVGAIEPRFFQELLKAIGVENPDDFEQMGDQKKLAAQFEKIFASKDKAYWAQISRENPNACLSPVLTFDEAAAFDHAKATQSFIKQPQDLGEGFEPMPVPTSLSADFASKNESPVDPPCGQHTRQILSFLLGITRSEIDMLKNQEVIECSDEPSSEKSKL